VVAWRTSNIPGRRSERYEVADVKDDRVVAEQARWLRPRWPVAYCRALPTAERNDFGPSATCASYKKRASIGHVSHSMLRKYREFPDVLLEQRDEIALIDDE